VNVRAGELTSLRKDHVTRAHPLGGAVEQATKALADVQVAAGEQRRVRASDGPPVSFRTPSASPCAALLLPPAAIAAPLPHDGSAMYPAPAPRPLAASAAGPSSSSWLRGRADDTTAALAASRAALATDASAPSSSGGDSGVSNSALDATAALRAPALANPSPAVASILGRAAAAALVD